jgi:hypothetical protein
MNPFNLTRYALLALVAVSLGTWAVRTWRPAGGSAATVAASAALPADGVVVINFHGATRCATCQEIGKEARALVETDFASELQSGRMSWQVIDFDEPANRHYVQDYGLVSSTVVVVRREHGRDATWRRLDAVWDHVFDAPAMNDYLRREITQVSATAATP